MTLRKQEDTGSWRRKLRIAFFGELSLEEAMDLSEDTILLGLIVYIIFIVLETETMFPDHDAETLIFFFWGT
jgi:hypothetical protein